MPVKFLSSRRDRRMVLRPSIIGGTSGGDIMAKGMDKRKRDEKKPKKEKPKTNASAPSTKDVVSKAVAQQNR